MSSADEIYAQLQDPNFDPSAWLMENEHDLATTTVVPLNGVELNILQEKYTFWWTKEIEATLAAERRDGYLEKDFSCSVCMCELVAGDNAVELPTCKHIYHWTCIRLWLERKSDCPKDRLGLRGNLIKDLHGKPKGWKISFQGLTSGV